MDELGGEGYVAKKDRERGAAVRELREAYDNIYSAKQHYTQALQNCERLGISRNAMAMELGISEAAVRSWMRRHEDTSV